MTQGASSVDDIQTPPEVILSAQPDLHLLITQTTWWGCKDRSDRKDCTPSSVSSQQAELREWWRVFETVWYAQWEQIFKKYPDTLEKKKKKRRNNTWPMHACEWEAGSFVMLSKFYCFKQWLGTFLWRLYKALRAQTCSQRRKTTWGHAKNMQSILTSFKRDQVQPQEPLSCMIQSHNSTCIPLMLQLQPDIPAETKHVSTKKHACTLRPRGAAVAVCLLSPQKSAKRRHINHRTFNSWNHLLCSHLKD